MVLYFVFLGLLFQSAASCASFCLPERSMEEEAKNYLFGSRLDRRVLHLAAQAYAKHDYRNIAPERLVQAALVSEPTDPGFFDNAVRSCTGLSESSAALLEKHPDIKDKLFVVAQAITEGHKPKMVPTYLNKREISQLTLEAPESYVARILSSESRLRASSAPVVSPHELRAASPVARSASAVVQPSAIQSERDVTIAESAGAKASEIRPSILTSALPANPYIAGYYRRPVAEFYSRPVAGDITECLGAYDGLPNGSRLELPKVASPTFLQDTRLQ